MINNDRVGKRTLAALDNNHLDCHPCCVYIFLEQAVQKIAKEVISLLKKGEYKARVICIVRNTDKTKSDYVVTEVKGMDSRVTFTLASPVWEEKDEPKSGHFVVLSQLTEKEGIGWRANKARFFKPEDSK